MSDFFAALVGFFKALPELVKLVKPFADFFLELTKHDPAKAAAELGPLLSQLVDSIREKDMAEKERKKDASLKGISDFLSSS